MKHYCGTYKGYKVYQEGQMIGNGFYGKFYASQKKGERYCKLKNSVCDSVEEIKKYIENHV